MLANIKCCDSLLHRILTTIVKRPCQNSSPSNALTLLRGRKGHSRGSVWWITAALIVVVALFASVPANADIGASLLTSIADPSNLNSYDFPSANYSNNILYIAFTASSCATSEGCTAGSVPTVTSVSGAGLTFTEIGTAGGLTYSSTNRRIQAWRALATSGAGTGVVTVTLDGTSYSMGAVIIEFTGTKTSGTNGADAVVQSNTNSGSGITNLEVTLNAFSDSRNRPVAFFAHRAAESTTHETGYTELYDNNHSTTPVMGYMAEWHHTTAETTPYASWSTSVSGGGFALEIGAAAAVGDSILLVTPDAGNLTAQDSRRKALIESWGYNVVTISASDSQANFDAAVATASAVYVSEEISSTDLGTKLRDAAIGVVIEEYGLVDEFGIASGASNSTETAIDITDNTHYITSPFSTGSLTVATPGQSFHGTSGTIAGGAQVLAEMPGTSNGALVVIDIGGDLYGGGTAAGRRVWLPWGNDTFDINALNADGQLIMRRAIEWAADVTTNYRSIGTNSGTLYNTGNASIDVDTATVTFGGGASLPVSTAVGAVGAGDKLTLDPGGPNEEVLYTLSRDDDTHVTVQTAATSTHTSESYTITRAYNDFQSWESGQQGTGDLVGENRIEVGVAYKDGVFTPTSTTTINDYSTDSSHYLQLTVAQGQRHNGTAGTGVIVDGSSIAASHAFHIRDPYFRMEWLEIRNFPGDTVTGEPINVDEGEAAEAFFSHLLIHDYTSTARGAINVYENTTVRNSIFYNGDVGIRTYSNGGATPTLTLENVTIYGMSGDGVFHTAGTITIKNVISVGNLDDDFDLQTGTTVHADSGYNMYDTWEDQQPGSTGNQTPPVDKEDLFVSIVSTSEDLHLESSGHNALNNGIDLSTSFPDDIDGETRPTGVGTWDIGADEYYTSGLSWWDPGYAYRKQIPITAPALKDVASGYPVKLTIDHAALYSAGKSQDDGDDIRIVYWNGSSWTEVDRTLFNNNLTGSSWNQSDTTIMFKTQAAITAGESDIGYYLYYGNGSASSPPTNTLSSRYFVAQDLTETTTSSSTYATKVSLTFTPSDTSEHWVVVGSWRQSSTGSSNAYAGESQFLVNSVPRTGTSRVGFRQSENLWKTFTGVLKITGASSPQTVELQFAAFGGTDAIDNARLIAFMIPDPTNADVQYSENLGITSDTVDPTDALTSTFSPPSAGDYIWMASGSNHEGPGGGSQGGLFAKDETGADQQNTRETHIPQANSFVPFSHVEQRTLTTGSKTFTIQHRPDDPDGSERQGLTMLLFRSDVFDLVETANSTANNSTTSSTYVDKSPALTLTTASVGSNRDYIYLVAMGMYEVTNDITTSTAGEVRLDGAQQTEEVIMIARDNYNREVTWAYAETSTGDRTLNARYRSSAGQTAHARYGHIVSLRYIEPNTSLGGEEYPPSGDGTLTVGSTGNQTSSMSIPGTDNYLGGAFTFVRDTGSADVTRIVVSETNTVDAASNLSNLKIYYETAATCTYDGDETLFGVGSFDSSDQATVTAFPGGVITYDSGSGDGVYEQRDGAMDIVFDADGNIYAAGSHGANGGDLLVRKYVAAGTLDTTWGNSGMVTYNSGGSNWDRAWGVAIDSSKSVYAAGQQGTNSNDWVIRKYDANGDLDTTWGDGDSGMINYNGGGKEEAYAIAVDSSNNIYVTGLIATNGGDLAVRKYDANGDLDTTWGNSGMVTYDSVGTEDFGRAIAVDSSNNIYVAGYRNYDPPNTGDWVILKYDANGNLDTSWGDSDSGIITYSYGASGDEGARGIIVDSAGTIYVTGLIAASDADMAVRKYDANGDLDTSWGNSGMVTADSGDTDWGEKLALDSQGNLFVVGKWGDTSINGGDFALHKYYSNGDPDTTFGTSGRVTWNSSGSTRDFPFAIRLDSAGNICVGGYQASNNYDLNIVKFLPTGDQAQPMTVGTSQVCVYVVLDVGSGVSSGDLLDIAISNPSADVTVSDGTVDPGTAVEIPDTTTLNPPITIYYSVGTSTAPLYSGDASASSGTLTLQGGPAVYNIGVGDEVREGSNRYYITGRNSSTEFTIQNSAANGGTPGDANITFGTTGITIYRAFNSLTAAEAGSSDASHLDIEPDRNLVAGGFQLNLACYNDGPDPSSYVRIDEPWVTGPANYIRVFTPTDPSQVGVSQRHTGKAGTGYRIVPTEAPPAAYYNFILVSTINGYVRIEGVEIDGSNVTGGEHLRGIMVNETDGTSQDVRISHNIIHDITNSTADDSDKSNVMGIFIDRTTDTKVSNNIIYNLTNVSENGSSETVGIHSDDAGFTQWVYNNTIYNMRNTNTTAAGTVQGIQDALGGTVYARNNYVGLVDSTMGSEDCFLGSFAAENNNVSSDGTAIGTDSQNGKSDYASYFVNVTAGSEDFHLLGNSNTLWGSFGEDLDGDPNLPVIDDIDGDGRASTQPDIGADEASVDWYVDGNYSGTETGSETQPFNTIMEAVNAASGGDTIHIKGDYTYNTEQVVIAGVLSGSSGNKTTFQKWEGPEANPIVSYTSTAVRIWANYLIWDAIDVTNTTQYHGFDIYGDNITIQNSTIFGCFQKGIQIDTPATNTTVRNCTIRNNGSIGIHLRPGSSATTIDHCIIRDNGSAGITIQSNSNVIYNNTIDGNTWIGIRMIGGSGNDIYNNIVSNNGDVGINDEDAGNDPNEDYNCLYNNSGGNYSGFSLGANSIETDPFFVDRTNKNFHLQSTAGYYPFGGSDKSGSYSPCIDAGQTSGSYSGYNNEPEDNGDRVNMGAYGNTYQASLSGPLDFGHRRQLTLNCSGRGASCSASLSDFPVLIDTTNWPQADKDNLKTIANGGRVYSSHGYDIIFRASDSETQLDHEIEKYDGATGTLVAWVRIPTLFDQCPTTGTTIYLYYGNPAITDATANPTGVWDSDYKGVWHLAEKYGLDFDGADSFVDTGYNTHHTLTTIEAWIYPEGWGEGSLGRVIDKRQGGAQVLLLYLWSTGQLAFERMFDGNDGKWQTPAGTIALDTWQHIVVTYDESDPANDPSIYINGQLQTLNESSTPSGTAITNTDDYLVGNRGTGDRTFDGIIDELKIYNRILTPQEINDRFLGKQEPTRNGLVLEYLMDEGSGNSLSDSSGNSHHGDMTGHAASWVRPRVHDSTGNSNFGKREGSMAAPEEGINSCDLFDGSDDLINVDDDGRLDMGTGDFTVETWARLDSSTTDSIPTMIFNGAGSGSDPGYWLFQNDSIPGVRFTISDGSGATRPLVNSDIDIKDDKWHHVVAVADRNGADGTLSLHIDGDPHGQANFTSYPGSIDSGDNWFLISASDPDATWMGNLDEVRVSSIVRDDCWIETEFSNQDDSSSFVGVGGEEGSSATLTLADHTAGQGTDKFADTSPVTDVLFRFSLTRSGTVTVSDVRVNYITGSGIFDGDVTAGALYRDENNDGVVDGGDTALKTGIAGSGGQLAFIALNESPSTSGTDYLVQATVSNLVEGDTTTFSLTAADIDEVEGGITESGSIAAAMHTTDAPTEVTIQIGGSYDDAHESDNELQFKPLETNVSIIRNISGSVNKYNGGFRFAAIDIPQGAIINSATFSGYLYSATYDQMYATIYGHAADNSPDFTAPNDSIVNTGVRPRTTASVAWQEVFGSTGWKTKDVTSIVQEIIDRPGWSNNNAITLLFISDNSSMNAPCYFSAYDGAPAEAAKLTINYTPRNKLYRSVGITATDLNTDSRTAEISGSTATFSGDMPANVGVGDVLVYNNGSDRIAFIHGRTSTTVFTVKDKDGGTPAAAAAGTSVGVFRAYTSLSNWESQIENANISEPTEDDVNPSTDLVATNTIMMVPCYGDGEDTASVYIDSWTTGPNNYIKIYTPTSLSEVGTSQRHNGAWDTSAYRISQDGSYFAPIGVRERYIRIDGLQIDSNVEHNGESNGIHVSDDNSDAPVEIHISNSIFRMTAAPPSTAAFGIGALNGFGDVTFDNSLYVAKVWNNIIYGYAVSGGGGTCIYAQNYGTVYAYNNTCVGGSGATNGIAAWDNVDFYAKNNMSIDFTDPYKNTFNAESTNNVSDTGDAPGSNPINGEPTFVDKAGNDYHLANTDTVAQGAGADLDGDSNLAMVDDIDGDHRDSTQPDIGADEIFDVILSEHTSGQISDQFDGSASQDDKTLFRFRLNNKTASAVTIDQIVFHLSDVEGIETADLSDLKICWAAASCYSLAAPTVEITGDTGTITFYQDWSMGALFANNYYLRGDATNLLSLDTLTISMEPSDVALVSGSVGGTAPSDATHTTDAPLAGPFEYRKSIEIDRTKIANPAGTLPIAFDALSSAQTADTGASSLSWSHTIGSGSDRIVIVSVSTRLGQTISSVTFGGTDITSNLIGSAVNSGNCAVYMYYMKNPSVGPNTVVVTQSGTVRFIGAATSFFNVNQSTPFGTFASNTGTSNPRPSPSVTVTNASGEVVVTAFAKTHSYGATKGVTNHQVERWNRATADATPANNIMGAGALATGSGPSVDISWQLDDSTTQYWAIGGVAVRPTTLEPPQITTLTNYPLLYSVTDTDLRDHVTNANGWDIIFRAEDDTTCGGAGLSPCTLDHEIERYESGTGRLVAWVRLPSVNGAAAGSNTVIYIYYGNSSITAPTENKNGVWDSDFMEVWHLGETSGAPLDSTSNNYSGTIETPGNVTQDAAGKNTPAYHFAGGDGTPSWLTLTDGTLTANEPYAIETWLYIDTTVPTWWVGFVTKDRDSGLDQSIANWGGLWTDDTTENILFGCDYNDGGNLFGSTLSAGQWYHSVAVFDGGLRTLYLNGQRDPSALVSSPTVYLVDMTMPLRINNDSNNNGMTGVFDEVRVSTAVRTPGWILTSYNNMNDPGDIGSPGFYTVGGEEATPATAVDLVSFTAKGAGNSVLVEWETAQELNHMGFHLYRARSAWGPFTRLTDKLISGLTFSIVGQQYSYEDKDVTPGEIYYYQLEDLDIYGKKTLHGPICVDWDGDGLPDDWEIAHGLNPGFDDADLDWDGDGLTNLQEYLRGTDPFNPDTDGDGILDGDEGVKRDPDDQRISATLGPGVYLVASDETGVTLELRTDTFDFDIVQAEGQEFERLRIQDYIHGFTDQAGKPELPLKGILVDIPQGYATTLTVLETEAEVHTGYRIYPVPETVVDDQDQLSHVGETFVIDEAAYTVDAFYPDAAALLGKDYLFRGQQKQQIFFYPLTFNPATGQLRHLRRIRVRVDYVDAEAVKTSGPEPTVWKPPVVEELSVDAFSLMAAAAWEPPSEASPVYKILVSEEGIYRLSKTWLQAQGVDVTAIDLSQVRIYNLGQEITISVYDEDGDTQFDPQDYIDFYGKTVEETYAKYTDNNVYWLTLEGGAGAPKRMAPIDSTPGSGGVPATYIFTVHHEEDREYWPKAPGGDGLDRYFFHPYVVGAEVGYTPPPGDPKPGDPVSFSFPVPGVAGQGTLKIMLGGTWNTDHQVAVSLNTTHLGSYSWSGIAFYETQIDNVDLVDGMNTVTLECLTGQDSIAVDWFEVTYPRRFEANNDVLRFSHETGYRFQVSEFSGNNLLAFDITSPGNVERLVNFQTTGSGPYYTLDFEPQIASGQKTYLVLTSDQLLTPAAIIEDKYGNLANPATGADYILITHRDLGWDINGDPYLWLTDLVSLRQGQGLRVKVVDAEDIFDEFSYGIESPEAIRDFISYAYTNWTPPAPQYVLLGGDSTRNPKNNPDPWFGTDTVTAYLPTYLMLTEHAGETATDEWFVRVSGDDAISDLYLGRLPAVTVAQAEVMVGKIVSYETTPNTKTWEKNVVLVSDNPTQDYETLFETTNEDAAALLPSPMGSPFKGYLADYLTAADLTRDLETWIDAGALLVNYSGHGSNQILASEQIFEEGQPPSYRQDVSALANGEKLPVFVTMTCLSGYFAWPEAWDYPLPSLAEALLRAEDKGAVAAFMSTGLTTTEGQHVLDTALFGAIFTRDVRVLGQAVSAAKQTLMANGGSLYQEVNETFLLFGDPAMALKVPLPHRPEGLRAQGQTSSVALNWNPATDCNGAAVSGYNLYRSTTPGGPYTKVNTSLITQSQYDDTSVSSTMAQYSSSSAASGTTYYYVVTSVDDEVGESVYSQEASSGTQSANPSAGESSGGGGGGGGCFINTVTGN
jgi:uncharacterized delta-60 repeat protein